MSWSPADLAYNGPGLAEIVGNGDPRGGAYTHDGNEGGFWYGANALGDFLTGQDTFAHNEAVLERNFNATEAQKMRDFEKMMSDTAFQRQAADLEKAGLSKLALIGGNGASTPSTSPAHQANSPKNGGNGFGNLLGSLARVVAFAFTHGASTATETFSKASSAVANAEATKEISQGTKKAISYAKKTGDLTPIVEKLTDNEHQYTEEDVKKAFAELRETRKREGW